MPCNSAKHADAVLSAIKSTCNNNNNSTNVSNVILKTMTGLTDWKINSALAYLKENRFISCSFCTGKGKGGIQRTITVMD